MVAWLAVRWLMARVGTYHVSCSSRSAIARCSWQAMLAAQMQKSADKAMAAVSVVITAARLVAVFGKMREHQIEQLHRLRDLGFRHWFERSRS